MGKRLDGSPCTGECFWESGCANTERCREARTCLAAWQRAKILGAISNTDHHSDPKQPESGDLDHFSDVHEILARLAYPHGIHDDHMTSCDKTMGVSHPCNCGADAAREYLRQLSPAPDIRSEDDE